MKHPSGGVLHFTMNSMSQLGDDLLIYKNIYIFKSELTECLYLLTKSMNKLETI